MDEAEFREALISAIHALGLGSPTAGGVGALEGLGMALAGNDFITRENNLTNAVYAVASALDRIADAMESKTP